jgi:hypothetical protein
MKPMPDTATRRPRPLAVTCIALGGLTFAVFYLGRFALSLPLPPLPLSVPRWYLPLTGALWGALGLALTVGLWRGIRWAYRVTFWAAPIYLVWYWADRLLLVRSDFAAASQPAALVVSAAALALLFWALTRSSTRDFFRENANG